MKIDKSKYEEILNELINSYFPLLKGEGIYLDFIENKNKGSAFVDEKTGRFIWINTIYDIYDEYEIKGLLAHELGHIEENIILGELTKEISDLCRFYPHLKEYYEKITDIKVIEKGIGKELKACREKREEKSDNNFKENARFYLSSTEIEKILLEESF